MKKNIGRKLEHLALAALVLALLAVLLVNATAKRDTPPETTAVTTTVTTTEPPTTEPPIDPSKPMIALTFDDGPSQYTPRVLDILERYGARATFCVVGERVDAGKDAVRRASDMGCEIIGHSWSHRNLSRLKADTIQKELDDTAGAIEAAAGARPRLYRPPYGAVNQKLKDVSAALGYALVTWSVDPLDWKTRDADAVYDAVMNNASDKAIVLSHDLYETTVSAYERIIPALIDRGYQLVTVSEMMECAGKGMEAGMVYFNGE